MEVQVEICPPSFAMFPFYPQAAKGSFKARVPQMTTNPNSSGRYAINGMLLKLVAEHGS